MTKDNTETPTIEETFERYKTYKLKFPYANGSKLISELKIEVPSGQQILAMSKVGNGEGSELEMLAQLISQCADVRLTPTQILEFKFPDLQELTKVCADFLQ